MRTRPEDVPKELIVDFDVYDESLVGVAHERLAEIQENTGIAYCPAHGGYWMVTNYDDVYEVIRNDDVYSSMQTAVEANTQRLPPLHYDPPEHTAYRTLVNPVFSPARMKAVEEDIRTEARSLIDAFADRGSCEFVSEFAHPLTTITFLSLMGWPMDDLSRMAVWTEGLLIGREGASDEELRATRLAIRGEVHEYFGHFIEERRANLDVDDVTGHLLRARYEGDRPLTDDELIRMLSFLMVAGLHTVRGIMGYGMISLSENPAERQRLIDDPSLMPSAVEELLRTGVGTAPGRLVLEPVELHGVTLQPGDVVLSMLSSANRDPAVFECPHELQLDRPTNRHLSFAAGRHRCLGSNLARAELAVAFDEILARIPDFRVDPDRQPKFHHGPIRGIRELHLLFSPEHGVG